MLEQIEKELKSYSNPEKAKLLSGFFKTGKGQYGEGDVFAGIMVPYQRIIAKKYKDVELKELQKLISSKFHEHRLTAFLILTYKYPKSEDKKELYDFYMKNLKHANNWDLVDLSAPRIVGQYLLDKPRDVLYQLAKSSDLWECRVAVLSTFVFISHKQYDDSIKIAELLLDDKHDLIHKAVGWMLREIGKRDVKTEEAFLDKHAKKMPRTMLRYAIEKFDDKMRKHYLNL